MKIKMVLAIIIYYIIIIILYSNNTISLPCFDHELPRAWRGRGRANIIIYIHMHACIQGRDTKKGFQNLSLII